jgi:flavodoxin
MKTLVIYDSQFGNTQRLAELMAQRLGAGEALWAADGTAKGALELRDWDLLVLGAPTQNHTASLTMRALLQGLPRGALEGASVAVFDTRYRIMRFLTGSAASWIAAHVRRAGAKLMLSPESFFIEQDTPPPGEKRRHDHEHLEAGEEDRAQTWASGLLASEVTATPM